MIGRPRVGNVQKVADALGTSVSYLWSGLERSTEYKDRPQDAADTYLRHVMSLARSMVAEAADLPLTSVSITLHGADLGSPKS